MNTFNLLITTICFFASFVANANSSGTRGGGDDIGLEFQTAYAAAAFRLKISQPELFKILKSCNANQIASDAQVVVVDEVLPVNFRAIVQNSVATNSPEENLVLINRVRWSAITNEFVKEAIALHEVLSLAGVERTGSYPVSGAFLSSQNISTLEISRRLPIPEKEKSGLADAQKVRTNDRSSTQTGNFEGTVALSNSSGSIVRLLSSTETDKALLFASAAGYEGGTVPPNTFIANVPSSRLFKLRNANGQSTATLHASRVIYSTMTGTDLLIYELEETYADLSSQYGIQPYTLSKSVASAQDVEIPSGYWTRQYSCHIESVVPALKQDQYSWRNSLRLDSGCGIVAGAGGSPIIAKGTRNMIGIIGTQNSNTGPACSLGNACEVNSSGQTSTIANRSYGQQVAQVYSCINVAGEFDLAKPGCSLLH